MWGRGRCHQSCVALVRMLVVFRGPCRSFEEVVPVNESTWVLLEGVTVGR
jgi:hypothetical protein